MNIICVTMVYTTLTDKILCMHHQALMNARTQLKSENLHYLHEARNLITRKNIIKANLILWLKKIMMQQVHCYKVSKKEFIPEIVPLPTNTIVSACLPYQQSCNYPITMNDWSSFHAPLLAVDPVPVYLPTTSPIYATNISPLTGTVAQPLFSQYFMEEYISNLPKYENDFDYSAGYADGVTEIGSEESYSMSAIISQTNKSLVNTGLPDACTEIQATNNDPIEFYLKLPKEFFPTPRMLTVDPNPIIDEFCKMQNLQFHTPWLLDLEFGIPKSPITRPIPTYNVKFNSIHCKNEPDAIHPGFESCNPDFKRALLFYYDCIVSAWYRGYMIMHCDGSVENFQSWLLLPMQVLGMGWP